MNINKYLNKYLSVSILAVSIFIIALIVVGVGLVILQGNLSVDKIETIRAANGTAGPVIFYTDITSGPKTGGENNNGVYVTIAGKNFGASRGSSIVTIGGGEVIEYKVWQDDEIAVQLGPNVQTGPIKVIINGQQSTTVELLYREAGDIIFTVRPANIYFISTTGSNSNPGAFELPKAGVGGSGAKSMMTGGDFLYVRGGNYITDDSYGVFFRMDAAWDGSEGAPTVVSGYPGETVAISGGGITRAYGSTSRHDFVFAHFTRVGNSVSLRGTYRIWLIDNDLSGGTGATGSIYSDRIYDVYFYGNKVHSNAATADNYFHLIYLSNVGGAGVPFSGSHHLYFGWNKIGNTTNNVNGLHFYTDSYSYDTSFDQIYIHHNLFHDTDRGGLWLSSYMKNAWVWDNIFYNCGRASYAGLGIGGVVPDNTIHIYNNTFYDNPSGHLSLDARSVTNVDIKNNLFYSTNSSQRYIYDVNGDWPDNLLTVSNNLYYGAGDSYYLDTNPFTGNPQFVNTAVKDFHLQETSPAIDRGTDQLFSPAFPTLTVHNDYDGILRPQDGFYDIGAYEYAGIYVEPTACQDAGGNCQTNPCSNYDNCSVINGTCAIGYCCQGTCIQPPPPNITLSKQVDKSLANQGEELTYTITYTNTGQGNASNVIITDNIPTGTNYVAGSVSSGGFYNGSKVSWNIASVFAGTNGTVSFKVQIQEQLTGQTFTERYGVSSTGLVLWLDQQDPRSQGDEANWYDMSGQDNHATQTTTSYQPTIIVDGVPARDFDGSDDYLSITNTPSLQDIKAISLWFISDNSASEGIMDQYVDNSNRWNLIGSYQDYNCPMVWGQPHFFPQIEADNDYADSKWHHMAVTWNGSTLYMFVNGIQQTGTDNNNPFDSGTTGDINIGRYRYSTGNQYLDGFISEVFIFNRALTPAEIQQLYNIDKARHGL